MAYKKLKTFKANGVSIEGNRGDFRNATDQQIYIEATGKCRLFVKVPDYVAGALSGWKDGGSKLETIGKGTASGEEHIIAGRDPEDLAAGWNAICQAYKVFMETRNLRRVISIKSSERRHHHSLVATQNAAIDLEFTRYIVNTKPDGSEQRYQWSESDDNLKPISHYPDRDAEIVPYDDALWSQLLGVAARINAAQQNLLELLEKREFAQKLLAGNAPLLLGNG